ncbi:MAG: voltage-gated chloride channel family protein [Acidobacteriaceae bacterium]
MPKTRSPKPRSPKPRFEQVHILTDLLRWLLIGGIAGMLAGTASALLLGSLNWATATRESHKWLIALLPLAGLAVGCMYKYYGGAVEAGNNLILDEVHDPKAVLPLRMTPLILLGTVITHLFGGSAGREGTAIQTGASLADQLTKPFGLQSRDRRILLMAGISGGFASVFGTPLAGAIFGIEVLAIGRMGYEAIFPCFIAAFVGEFVTHAWGIHHTIYRVTEVPAFSATGLLSSIVAGAVFGLVGMAFAKATHAVSALCKKTIRWSPLRPFAGGVVVAAAVFLLGTTRYIGLGIPTILDSFSMKLPPYDFVGKFLFTVVTLGSGFKGGEVTPLFYIGATLGNALSRLLPLPSSLLAGMGFVAVFAGAANTPISSTLMAVELFGPEAGSFAAIACVVSYLFSGHAGIYRAQRVGRSKHSSNHHEEGLSLDSVARSRIGPAYDPYGYSSETDILKGRLNPTMNKLTILRLYFCASELHRDERWWKRLMGQTLGGYLLQQAKQAGIEQAMLHAVVGGYLKGQKLAFHHGELPPAKLPQCLELVGDEDLLQVFIEQNRPKLDRVRVVFLRGEEARYEAAIQQGELEQLMERAETDEASAV